MRGINITSFYRVLAGEPVMVRDFPDNRLHEEEYAVNGSTIVIEFFDGRPVASRHGAARYNAQGQCITGHDGQ